MQGDRWRADVLQEVSLLLEDLRDDIAAWYYLSLRLHVQRAYHAASPGVAAAPAAPALRRLADVIAYPGAAADLLCQELSVGFDLLGPIAPGTGWRHLDGPRPPTPVRHVVSWGPTPVTPEPVSHCPQRRIPTSSSAVHGEERAGPPLRAHQRHRAVPVPQVLATDRKGRCPLLPPPPSLAVAFHSPSKCRQHGRRVQLLGHHLSQPLGAETTEPLFARSTRRTPTSASLGAAISALLDKLSVAQLLPGTSSSRPSAPRRSCARHLLQPREGFLPPGPRRRGPPRLAPGGLYIRLTTAGASRSPSGSCVPADVRVEHMPPAGLQASPRGAPSVSVAVSRSDFAFARDQEWHQLDFDFTCVYALLADFVGSGSFGAKLLVQPSSRISPLRGSRWTSMGSVPSFPVGRYAHGGTGGNTASPSTARPPLLGTGTRSPGVGTATPHTSGERIFP